MNDPEQKPPCNAPGSVSNPGGIVTHRGEGQNGCGGIIGDSRGPSTEDDPDDLASAESTRKRQ